MLVDGILHEKANAEYQDADTDLVGQVLTNEFFQVGLRSKNPGLAGSGIGGTYTGGGVMGFGVSDSGRTVVVAASCRTGGATVSGLTGGAGACTGGTTGGDTGVGMGGGVTGRDTGTGGTTGMAG